MANVKNPFASQFTQADLISADTACAAGVYTELGRYKVPAGVAIALGFGMTEGQESARGRLFIDLKDAGAVSLNGMVRIDIENPQKRPYCTIYENRAEVLRQGSGDPTKQQPFPMVGGAVPTQDWYVVLRFMPDAAKTVAKANSVILMANTSFECSK